VIQFFYKHPLLQQYRWYWRIEYVFCISSFSSTLIRNRPDVRFFCDIQFDPFLYMEDYNKTYGFTVALEELEGTIRSLWQTTRGTSPTHVQLAQWPQTDGYAVGRAQSLFRRTLIILPQTMQWTSYPAMEVVRTIFATVSHCLCFCFLFTLTEPWPSCSLEQL
jgi:hypothetical protein